jgi:hypothetical protein
MKNLGFFKFYQPKATGGGFLIFEWTIQRVSEISALILTGNRTHQKEQLFSLPFWRKTLRNGLKN